MEDISIKEIQGIVKGEIIIGRPDQPVKSVSIDSRRIRQGDLFWAIPGNRFDGHDYVVEALMRGAMGAVIARRELGQGLREIYSQQSNPPAIIMVTDTILALQELARAYRERFSLPVIGITGSNGKTTTKELIAHILSSKYKVLKNEGNLNNHIGLPLTLINLSGEHQVAVLELGMNRKGEIARLCEIAQPNTAVITNINYAHLEFLGSLEAVKEAKAELVDALREGDLLILNADDERVNSLQRRFTGRVYFYGLTPQAEIWADEIRLEGERGSSFVLHTPQQKGIRIALPLIGRANIYNALAGAAVGHAFGVPLEEIKGALESFTGVTMRLQPITLPQDIILIDDTYNANPSSVENALEILLSCRVAEGRRLMVLGDMLELGEAAERWHRAIGSRIAQAGIDFLITMGPLAHFMAKEALNEGMPEDRVFQCQDHREVGQLLVKILRPGDRLLVKGSRATNMDKIVKNLIRKMGEK